MRLMGKKNYKAFIVEGEVREQQIVHNLCNVYFKNSNTKIITIPAGQNIYMLWKRMQEDEFQTDVIEVLRESDKGIDNALNGISREDIAEVFLFFDYDGHQKNLSKEEIEVDVIYQMLEDFADETENGKLYVSYPMAEALRDYFPDSCGNKENCYCTCKEMAEYKRISADRAFRNDFRVYTYEDWRDVINVFVMRVSCLMDQNEVITYQIYTNEISPFAIYEKQQTHIQQEKIFILSAFPEFILDYYGYKLWKSSLKHTKLRPQNVERCK